MREIQRAERRDREGTKLFGGGDPDRTGDPRLMSFVGNIIIRPIGFISVTPLLAFGNPFNSLLYILKEQFLS